ncbi:solute carrier organic anion transporter family member 2A1 [Aplysia californica]|uniref:Solute carrier organic anion transporter family member n=1 Tax=Aplysia californica TaxID=6500 RepID=A0ABM0JUM0_APLCA|nr:solute carrier organic anion transporter family member 2A1 [Aplysia californica]
MALYQGVPQMLNSLDRLDQAGVDEATGDLDSSDYDPDLSTDDLYPTADNHDHIPSATAKVVGPGGKYYFPVQRLPDVPPMGSDHESDESETGQCGIGCCKPKCPQKCVSLPVFVMSYGVAGIWMIMTGSLLASQVTSIQRHLGLSSRWTSLILGANDMGQLFAVLLGSHFGKYTHIPRCLSVSGILFGLATLAMSLGRLQEPSLDQHSSVSTLMNVTVGSDINQKYVCVHKEPSELEVTSVNVTLSTVTPDLTGEPPEALRSSWVYWLLFIAALLGGTSKSFRIPLLTYYVEQNIKDKTRSALYLGSSFTTMVFGPPIAMLLGSYLSTLPFDLSDTTISQHDQRWIGAWWLGFLIVGGASIVFNVPIMFFPRSMKRRKPSHIEDDHAHKSEQDEKKQPRNSRLRRTRHVVMELPRSICRLFRRPVFLLALVSACVNWLAFAGFFMFLQKYVESQFNKTAQEVSLASGVVNIISMALGTFVGGLITTKLKLGLRGCVLVTMVTAASTSLLDFLQFIFGCDDSNIIGLTGGVVSSCECAPETILLSCGDDGRDYLSPCVAGCTNVTDSIFSNCTAANVTSLTPGQCQLDCPFFIPYMAVVFSSTLIACLGLMPSYMMTIRSVEPRDESLAAGLVSFIQTILGFLPSPVIYGILVDATCRLWSPGSGYCLLHHRDQLRFRFYGLNIGLRACDILVLAVMLWLVRKGDRGEREKEGKTKGKKEEGEGREMELR